MENDTKSKIFEMITKIENVEILNFLFVIIERCFNDYLLKSS